MYDTCVTLAKAAAGIVVIGTVLVGLFWAASMYHDGKEYLLVFSIAGLYVVVGIEEYLRARRRTGRSG